MNKNTVVYKDMIKALRGLEKKAEAEGFFEAMFTEKEREEFIRRLQILKRLKKGESQRSIAKDLGIGIATVTRGSNEMKKGKNRFIATL